MIFLEEILSFVCCLCFLFIDSFVTLPGQKGTWLMLFECGIVWLQWNASYTVMQLPLYLILMQEYIRHFVKTLICVVAHIRHLAFIRQFVKSWRIPPWSNHRRIEFTMGPRSIPTQNFFDERTNKIKVQLNLDKRHRYISVYGALLNWKHRVPLAETYKHEMWSCFSKVCIEQSMWWLLHICE